MTPAGRLTTAQVATAWSRGPAWRDSLHRDLAQLGLAWEDAESLMDDYSVGGMPVGVYWQAQHVIREHRRMRSMMHGEPVEDATSREELINQAAEAVAAGTDVFTARRELAVELTLRGMGEILFPMSYDPAVWDAVESADAQVIADYLRRCDTVYVPTVDSRPRTPEHPVPGGQRGEQAGDHPDSPAPAPPGQSRGEKAVSSMDVLTRASSTGTGRPTDVPAGLSTPRDVLRAVPVSQVRLHRLASGPRALFASTSTTRVLARYEARFAGTVFVNAMLEGSTFTLPEVHTLLDGVTPEGKKVEEVLEVENLARTVNTLHDDVASGSFRLDVEPLCSYNAVLTEGLLLEPGTVRGTGSVHGAPEGIAVNVRGRLFLGYDDTTTMPALVQAHDLIHQIDDPVDRALTYAALVAYVQPFSDGNKRTARLMADGELMAHGYDAVEIRATSRRDYAKAVAKMFETADTAPYVRFLTAQIQDPAA